MRLWDEPRDSYNDRTGTGTLTDRPSLQIFNYGTSRLTGRGRRHLRDEPPHGTLILTRSATGRAYGTSLLIRDSYIITDGGASCRFLIAGRGRRRLRTSLATLNYGAETLTTRAALRDSKMRDGGAYELALYGTHNYWGGGAVAFLEDGCLSAPSLLEYCPLCTGPGNTKALFGEGVPALHSVLATLTGRASLRDPYTGRASLLIGRASLLTIRRRRHLRDEPLDGIA